MSEHLDEMALEALATDRDDLVSEQALAHLDECESCAERVGLERLSIEDANLALERVQPELDVDAMVARAMLAVPAMGAAPSRRSLWLGAGLGALAAAGLGVLSLPETESINGLSTAGSQVYTLVHALDRVVEAMIPGGWTALAVGALALGMMLVVPMRFFLGGKPLRAGPAVTSMLAMGLIAVGTFTAVSAPTSLAYAYRLDGVWPAPEPTVTVDVERQPTSEALRQAAQSAGFGIAVVLPDDPLVSLHVSDAPIGEVLEALLGTSDVVVRPGRSLITVRLDDGNVLEVAPADASDTSDEPGEASEDAPRDESAQDGSTEEAAATEAARAEAAQAEGGASAADTDAPAPSLVNAAPNPPPATPNPPAGISDRVTFGDNVVIAEAEQVRDVFTMGGNAVVHGRAYGDVVTMGGNADIQGEVIGEVITMGGNIRVAPSAHIHGDINAMGGRVNVEEGATVHGQVLDESSMSGERTGPSRHHRLGKGGDTLASVFRWALFNVLIFLFGLFLMGAYRPRFETLRTELSDRPLRSTFGGFFGCGAAVMISGVLVVTIIGIPGSIVLSTLLVVGGGVGFAATAWWLGGVMPIGLVKDRPVAQLGLGLGVLFVVGLVPKLGTLVVMAAMLAGLGAVISTSFGQRTTAQKKAKKHTPTGPFRTSLPG